MPKEFPSRSVLFLEIRSQVGQGTRIHIRLPAIPECAGEP